MSLAAYKNTINQPGSERHTEHRALAMTTAGLVRARDEALKGQELVEALHLNRELWDIFAHDCASPGNKLPDRLRAQIISVAIFVNRYSSEVVHGRGTLDDLIDINRTVMGGLVPS